MDEIQGKLKKCALSLEEVMECPVCYSVMDSTLRLCINGHGVCFSCTGKINKCPSCQQELVFRQNTLLGQILEHLPKPCYYADIGCNTIVFDKEHEPFCEFREAKCFKTFCDWVGCVKDLIDHVKTCTNGSPVCEFLDLNVKKARCYTFDTTESKYFFTPIVFENQLFWKYFHRDGLEKCISHKFYHVPTTKPSNNYYLIISFKKGKIEFKHTCKAKKDSDLEKDSKSDSIENGLIIPDSELEHFKDPGSEMTYSFTVELLVTD